MYKIHFQFCTDNFCGATFNGNLGIERNMHDKKMIQLIKFPHEVDKKVIKHDEVNVNALSFSNLNAILIK